MKRPIEHEYNSFVSYARELEKYCSELESAARQALEACQESTLYQGIDPMLDCINKAVATLTAALESK
jgi:hypothetical protein